MKRSINYVPDSIDISVGTDRKITRQIDESVIRFQQIDIETYGENYKDDAIIFRIFGLTQSGLSIICNVTDYHPYFYVKLAEEYLASIDSIVSACEQHLRKEGYSNPIVDHKIVKKVDIYGYNSIQDVSFLKISFRNQMSSNACRRFFESAISFENFAGVLFSIYESNIPLVLKFMVDLNVFGMNWIEIETCHTLNAENVGRSLYFETSCKYIQSHSPTDEWSKMAPIKILSFDIECSAKKNHFPVPENDPVIAIACALKEYGSDTVKEQMIFCLRSCSAIPGATIHTFDREFELLEAFSKYIRQADPDVIIGYNILNFDLPYLITRASVLGCEEFSHLGRLPGVVSKVRDSFFSSKAYGTRENIDGRLIFDILQVMQRDYKLRSYSLNSVSAHFLNEQKEDVVPSIISDLFDGNEETRSRLCRYCLKDAILPLKLNDRLLLFVNYSEMARVTGVPFNYLLSRGQQVKVISQLLRKTLSLGYLLPALKNEGSAEEQYEGATVIEPQKGYYDVPITTLDFASLYPSIMMSQNLCYTTLIDGDYKKFGLQDSDVIRTPSGDFFVKPHVRKGVLPIILEDLISARKKAKAQLKEAEDPFVKASLDGRQLALKISANSVYGFTGATVGKLPCIQISQSVTSFGREMIERTKNLLESKFTRANGYEYDAQVIYGDTDSVMVNFGEISLSRAMELGREASVHVSSFFTKPISLEFEKCYFPYLLINKKRYAGLYWTKTENYDKLDTKGIETVRRDNCRLVQTVIDTCLKKILIERDVQGAISYVKSTISDLLMNRVDLSQLVITKALSKSGEEYAGKQAHVELAEKMKKRDASSAPSLGDRVAYIIIKSSKGAAAYERAEDPLYVLENNVPIDFRYYLDNQLAKPLHRIFEPILDNPNELLSGEHTRSVHVFSSPSNSAFSKFAVVKETCYKCRCILDSRQKLLCSHCSKDYASVFLDFVRLCLIIFSCVITMSWRSSSTVSGPNVSVAKEAITRIFYAQVRIVRYFICAAKCKRMLSNPGMCFQSFTIMKIPFEEFIEEFNQKNKCAPYIYGMQPFPHAVYKHVGLNLSVIHKHLDSLQYEERFTDLYKMYQTKEIQTKQVCDGVMNLIPALKTENIEVTGVYLSSQFYEKGSYLLCHDDQLEDRLFAFVFYIHKKEDVSLEDGGTLDLFNTNALQEPDGIVTHILPKNDSLALFEVSPRSFHQVSEVLGENFVRRSVGGWVRGRYKVGDKRLEETDFSRFEESVEHIAVDSLPEYFTLNSKYKIIKEFMLFEKTPAQYFFVEALYFDETSFCLNFQIEPQCDYFAYALELQGDRFVDCDLVEVHKSFHKFDANVKEQVVAIIPGAGTFFVLKCRKR